MSSIADSDQRFLPYNSEKRFRFLDQRRGYWTKIEFTPDQLSITKSRPRSFWLTTFLALLVCGILLAGIAKAFVQGVHLPVVFVIAALGFLFVAALLSAKHVRLLPIQIYSTDPPKSDDGTIVSVRDIHKVIVTENTRRDSDDFEFYQIYLSLKNSPTLLLVFQDYASKSRMPLVDAKADELRNWIASHIKN